MEKSSLNKSPSISSAGFHAGAFNAHAVKGEHQILIANGNQRQEAEDLLEAVRSSSVRGREPSGNSESKKNFLAKFNTFDYPEGKTLSVDALHALAESFNRKHPDTPLRINGTFNQRSSTPTQGDSGDSGAREQVDGFENTREDRFAFGIAHKPVGMSKEDAVKEILAISSQQTSQQSGVSGYFFTSERSGKESGHVESLLIDGQNIINVIPFSQSGKYQITARDLPGLYTSDVQQLVMPGEGGARARIHIMPQATEGECGSLGLAYLKEYLKEDCAQLKTYTLKLQFNDGSGEKRFFLPSPWVLRYSQSALYAKLMHAVVAGNDTYHTIEHEHKNGFGTVSYTARYKVLTLKGMLEKEGSWGPSRLPEDMSLHAFRERWMLGYESAMAKRDQMTAAENNQYLVYKSVRNHKKAKELLQP